ncbi:uncharacterized protein LOC121412673 [Lytechinus variegatus]|uniref:uncharacterized protein LOC121412673 n=1 Tax=Lytechinus variegatus TaxID=7654 RepID=UPI001BB19037|nr:uncharacterized protein LOC121412673 [Lytechinus variegatus]
MAVENRGRQPKKMERLHLKDRITLATCHLGTIEMEIKKEEDRLLKLVQELGDARLESEQSKRELLKEEKLYRQLLDYSKAQEDTKALDARSRAVEIELLVLRRRKWKTDMMLDAATAEVSLLDHRLKKEQTLQEEQKERRLGSKRRRFQQTTIKVNALAALIILQVILLVMALWHL